MAYKSYNNIVRGNCEVEKNCQLLEFSSKLIPNVFALFAEGHL